MDKLKTLQSFVLVCEQGSFINAAKIEGSAPSTISKAITRLEEHLGCILFHRTTRQIKLTKQGAKYLQTVKIVLNDLGQSEKTLRDSHFSEKGTLKINMPISYGRLYILPTLKDFHQLYPDIQLDLTFSDEYLDPITHGIDISIRTGSVQNESLIVRKISPLNFVTCASQQYINKYGKPDNYKDINEHKWIRFRFQQTGKVLPIMYHDNNQIHEINPDNTFIVDDGEAMASLCADGLGLCQMPHFIARNWVLSGQIQQVLPDVITPQFGVYFILGYHRKIPGKVRVFVDFVKSQLELKGETAQHSWIKQM